MNDADLWRAFDAVHGMLGGEASPVEDKAGCACVLCGGAVIRDGAEYVCLECWTVQGRVLDTSAEWRIFAGDAGAARDAAVRCGMPTNPLMPVSSLGSVIGGPGRGWEVRVMQRCQLWASMPHGERALCGVFDRMATVSAMYGVTAKVLADAKALYKAARDVQISRGDHREGLIAACVFNAFVLNGVPRSAKEVAHMFRIDPLVLTKGLARFRASVEVVSKATSAADFIPRFGCALDMPYPAIADARELAQRVERLGTIDGSGATTTAATVLYFFCSARRMDLSKGREEGTRARIASVCEVSELTIAKLYKGLMPYKRWLMDGLGGVLARPC